MDIELRAISALLTANAAEQADFWNKQLPLATFPLREAELHWIYRFRERYGKFPSVEAFEAKFQDSPLAEVNDPLSATLDPLITQAAFSQVKKIIDTTAMMFEEKKDTGEILDYFRSASQKLEVTSPEYVDEDMNDPRLAFRRYQQQAKLRDVKGSFINTPWARLNKLLNFCRPGEQIIVAGRTSLGKSWLAFSWANYLGSLGIPVLVISKEMPSAQVADRLTALRFGLDWEKFRALAFDIDAQVKWKLAMYKAARTPYPIIVSGEETLEGTGLSQVHAKIQKVKPRVVIVDGAYMLTVKNLSRGASDVERLTAVSQGLKRIAKVTSVVDISVIQMNRDAEKSDGLAKGGIKTLYGADSWGQDADVVMEVAGKRGDSERAICVHKSRETNIGDFLVNFRLSPSPDFSEKNSMGANSALGSLQFKILS